LKTNLAANMIHTWKIIKMMWCNVACSRFHRHDDSNRLPAIIKPRWLQNDLQIIFIELIRINLHIWRPGLFNLFFPLLNPMCDQKANTYTTPKEKWYDTISQIQLPHDVLVSNARLYEQLIICVMQLIQHHLHQCNS
jgi:hypothetical protein